MKVLFVRDYFPGPKNPASSPWVFDQAQWIQLQGSEALVISPTPMIPFRNVLKGKSKLIDEPTNVWVDYKGISVIRPVYLKIPNNKMMAVTLHSLEKCLYRFNDLRKIDILHAHFGQNGYASLKLKEALKVPMITSFYGYDSGRLKYAYKKYYGELNKKCDLFLALSQDMKNDLIELGFDERKIRIHHLGVKVSNEYPDFLDRENFIFLCIARLSEGKGIQYAIYAYAEFLRKNHHLKNNTQLRIVGGGEYQSELIRLAKELNVESNIRFINNLISPDAREIVFNEIANSDVFLLPSFTTRSNSKEGTPVVLMEAQALGKPCISTRHAGIPEVILHEETGFIVPEKSIAEITYAMEKLYFDKALRMKYSFNAWEYIKGSFNQTIQNTSLMDMYYQFLK